MLIGAAKNQPAPELAIDNFMRTYHYTCASSVLYCFIRDVCKLFNCYGQTETDTDNLVWLMMAIYSFGRENGIRDERHRRRAKKPSAENPDREAIVRLLDKADPEALHLILIAARNLTRKGVKPNA